MTSNQGISLRAALLAVIVALLVGVVASLAIRPPGGAARARPAAAADPATEGEVIRWRMASAFGTGLPVLGEGIRYFAESLRKASGGRIRIKPYEPGELAPALSVTDAVRERKVEAGITWLGYDEGRIPAAALIGAVPFGMEPWEFMGWWYSGGGQALGEALYREHDLHPVLCGIIGPETAGWFRRPIESVEDLAGLKIRFPGIGGQVLQRLGASVTTLPSSEIFQALEKGAIDATEFSQPSLDRLLGFDRIARYNYYPGWHQTFSALHLVVNVDTWNGLGQSSRDLIELACNATNSHVLAVSEAAQGAVLREFRASGVTIGTLDRRMLERLRSVTNEVLEEHAARDEQFARILASQRAFSETYALWKRAAYLPRDF